MRNDPPSYFDTAVNMVAVPDTAKVKWWLKGTGLAVLAVGVLLGLADLSGWLRNPSRAAFVDWAQQSDVGLLISAPPAQAFIEQFPAPEGVSSSQITHVTKYVQRLENGPALDMAFNYMLADRSRTAYVATLAEVSDWASASPYPWLAWILTAIGFVTVAGGTAIEWQLERRAV